jgi:hypothetical protein
VRVSGGACQGPSLLEPFARTLQFPDLSQREAEFRKESAPKRPIRAEVDGAAEQGDGRPCVLSRARSSGGGGQPLGATFTESRVGRPELDPVAMRLLQVVADDLVGSLVAQLGRQPVRVTPVQRRALPLRDRLVGRVANEDMAEAEAVVARHSRPIGPDHLLPHEREQMGADLASLALRKKLEDSATVEEPSFDGAELDHRPLLPGEPIDRSRQQRLQGRRHLELAVSGLGVHRDELLDEEGVPLGGLDDPRPPLGGDLSELRHQCLAVRPRQRLERQQGRVRLRRSPTRP